jgi:hypothetical protein
MFPGCWRYLCCVSDLCPPGCQHRDCCRNYQAKKTQSTCQHAEMADVFIADELFATLGWSRDSHFWRSLLVLKDDDSVTLAHRRKDQWTCWFTDASDLHCGFVIIQIYPEDVTWKMNTSLENELMGRLALDEERVTHPQTGWYQEGSGAWSWVMWNKPESGCREQILPRIRRSIPCSWQEQTQRKNLWY